MNPFLKNLLLLVGLFASQLARAQPPHMHRPAPEMETNVFLGMMDSMMVRMQNVPEGTSAETDFMQRMIPHHAGAIAMANYEISHGKDFAMVQLAKSIRAEQAIEVQQMRAWLAQPPAENAPITPAFRRAMQQAMTMMMQQLPDPAALSGTDQAFARVMIPHHQAAVDMARAVLSQTDDSYVRAFAQRIIASQQVEIEQMFFFLN